MSAWSGTTPESSHKTPTRPSSSTTRPSTANGTGFHSVSGRCAPKCDTIVLRQHQHVMVVGPAAFHVANDPDAFDGAGNVDDLARLRKRDAEVAQIRVAVAGVAKTGSIILAHDLGP